MRNGYASLLSDPAEHYGIINLAEEVLKCNNWFNLQHFATSKCFTKPFLTRK